MRALAGILALSSCAPIEIDAREDASIPDVAVPEEPTVVPAVPGPEVLASDLVGPCGLALGTEVLYVAERGRARVLALPLDGGPPSIVHADLGEPSMIAVAGEVLFVTDRAEGKVVRLDGEPSIVAEGQAGLGRIRVHGEFVYWVAEGDVWTGAVRRAPLSGGPVEDLMIGLRSPRGLSITDDACYFTERGRQLVRGVSLAGGSPIAIEDPDGAPVDVLSTDAEIFWISQGRRSGGWIHRAPLDLSRKERTSFTPPGPSWMGLDDAAIYVGTSQTVSRAPRDGGAYEDLVVATAPCDLVIDGSRAYWTEASTGRVLSIGLQ